MALPQHRDSLIDKRMSLLEARIAALEALQPPARRAELWQGKPLTVSTTRSDERSADTAGPVTS